MSPWRSGDTVRLVKDAPDYGLKVGDLVTVQLAGTGNSLGRSLIKKANGERRAIGNDYLAPLPTEKTHG